MNARPRGLASAPSRLRLGGAFVALLAVIPLALWRFALVSLGPDPDSDAYGHFNIAREVLVHPRNLEAHWVWLPLFHYLSAAAVWLGATMNTVRTANVWLTAVIPFVIFDLVSGPKAGERASPLEPPGLPRVAVAALAAVFFALNPIVMQMGTTGQTEPLFCLLMVAAAREASRGRFARLGVALSAAALVRYEAWAAWMAASALVALACVVAKPVPACGSRELLVTRGGLGVVMFPAAAILTWALARVVGGEPFFGFLRQTHDFAQDALRAAPSALDRLDDATYYAVKTPWRVLAEPLWLVPFGLVATARRFPWFVVLHGSMLAFVTATWMTHSQLGLDRHFMSFAPLYATFMAEGVLVLSTFAASLGRRVAGASWLGPTTFAFVAAVALVFGFQHLSPWMVDWTNAIRGAWPAERAVATFLRGTDSRSVIVCNDPFIEGVSELGRKRFDREVVLALDGAPGAPPMAAADDTHLRKLAREGEVWLVTRAESAPRLSPYGEVRFRTPEGALPSFVVLRVE